MNTSVKTWLLHITAAKLIVHKPYSGACEEEVPQDGNFNPGTWHYGRSVPMKGRSFLKTTLLALAAFSAESGWETAVLTRLSSSPELAFLRRKSWNGCSFFLCSLTAVQSTNSFFIQAAEATRIHPPDFENWPYKKDSSNFFSWDMVKYRLSFSLSCGFTTSLSWHKTGSCGKRWFCPPIPRFLPLPGVGSTGCVSLQLRSQLKPWINTRNPDATTGFSSLEELQLFLTLWQYQTLRCHSQHCQRMENESWNSYWL